jgi:hypothetical protein
MGWDAGENGLRFFFGAPMIGDVPARRHFPDGL